MGPAVIKPVIERAADGADAIHCENGEPNMEGKHLDKQPGGFDSLVRVLVFSLLGSLMVAQIGCQAAAVAIYKLHGLPDIPAKYVPEKTPMLVLVENYQAPSSAYTDADLLTRYLTLQLQAHAVPPLVDIEKLHDLQTTRPTDFSGMSTAAIGRATGAKQVLYVQLVKNVVEPLMGGRGLRGDVTVRVKIVDADTGASRWPIDLSAGYPLSKSTSLGTDQTSGNAMQIRQRMYQDLADEIAKLFYNWQPEDSPESQDLMSQ
jgi:hypothetical protein